MPFLTITVTVIIVLTFIGSSGACEKKSLLDIINESRTTTYHGDDVLITERPKVLLAARNKRWQKWEPGPRGDLCIATYGQTHFYHDNCRCTICMAPTIVKRPCRCSKNRNIPKDIHDTRCGFLPDHKFMNASNKCMEGYDCSECRKPFTTKHGCWSDRDTECECPERTYPYTSHDGQVVGCTAYPRCGPGEGIILQPNYDEPGGVTTFIWDCSSCVEGLVQPFFNSTDVCRPHRQVSCSHPHWKLIPGNATHDPICAPIEKVLDVSTPASPPQTLPSTSDEVPHNRESILQPTRQELKEETYTTGINLDPAKRPKESAEDTCVCKRSLSDEACSSGPGSFIIGLFSGAVCGVIMTTIVFLCKEYLAKKR